MSKKWTWEDRIFHFFMAFVIVFLLVVMIYPFLYVINSSISKPHGIGGSLLLLPNGLELSSYKTLLLDDKVAHALLISVARSIIGSSLMLVVSGMAAYVLAKEDLVFGKFFRTIFVLIIYLTAGVVPNYIFMKMYHLTNSFWVYILPNLVSGFNLILLRTYIESIPRSLQEAVYVDGGNDFQAYWKVIFPVCKPVNSAILLFGILNQWNNFMDTQMYCAMKEELHTLQYVLYNTLQSQTSIEALMNGSGNVTGQSLKMAITVITVLPVMFVYPFLQKHFVSGIMIGSVKA